LQPIGNNFYKISLKIDYRFLMQLIANTYSNKKI
jgi:hypothetical protein